VNRTTKIITNTRIQRRGDITSQKILVVLTSFEKYPNLNRATALWLGEAVHFVKRVEDAGYEVEFVSERWVYTDRPAQSRDGGSRRLGVVSEEGIHEPPRGNAETQRTLMTTSPSTLPEGMG
jgi:hypothetical protein